MFCVWEMRCHTLRDSVRSRNNRRYGFLSALISAIRGYLKLLVSARWRAIEPHECGHYEPSFPRSATGGTLAVGFHITSPQCKQG